MMENKLKRIDEEISFLKNRMEFGGPETRNLCQSLENVMRSLKVFDQKRHRSVQMESDLNRRFEGIVLSLEKITKVMKENGIV